MYCNINCILTDERFAEQEKQPISYISVIPKLKLQYLLEPRTSISKWS